MGRFVQTSYVAASWSKPRKVIARVEASEQVSDVRFIVTNLQVPADVTLSFEGVRRCRIARCYLRDGIGIIVACACV